MTNPRIFVALDYPNAKTAQAFIDLITPNQCGLKIGKELFIAAGPDFVKHQIKKGFHVFLDLKLHDIPNQVAGAVRSAANLDISFLTLHASGGKKMLAAALDALANYQNPPQLLAVTVLTSLSEDELRDMGISLSLTEFAKQLTRVAYDVGIRGFVSSAHEVAELKQLANDACFVTPGIRLSDDAKDDQTRITTPTAALSAGANYLVIGRPITQAKNPMAKLQQINEMIKGEM